MEALIIKRIAELWRYRQWWRTNRWADWPQVRHDLEVELRALIRLAREARQAEDVRPDPVTAAKAAEDPGWLNYHDHQARGPVTEPELFEGYGVDREGDPAFNGAFDRW